MPQKKNNPKPAAMTWKSASLVLVICVVFDAFRLMFQMFWFFGPALTALYCTSTASGWVGSLGGLTATACAAGAAALGFYGFALSATFGTVMAMAVGLLGWLTVALILLITNARIFKENAIWFGAGLLVSEMPIIGSIPALTLIVWKMYGTQIKTEKAEMKKYEKERAGAERQERQQQAAELMQMRATQLAQDDIY